MGATLDFDPTISTGVHRVGTRPLIGRDGELERFAAALASAREGTGVALVVEGDAGIGKTALLEAAQAHARASGMVVLTARGIELESGYPFGLVRQCFEPILRSAEQAERERLLSGAAMLAAPVVTDAPGDPSAASFGVLHGLYWLVANLAEHQPPLIAIDDAHWADEASLRFIAYVLGRIESLAAALIVATRPPGPGPDEPSALTEILADRHHELLIPAPLDEAAVTELLRQTGPVDDRFARACHHASSGNPFLLTELERTLREEQVPFTAAGATRVGEVTPPQVARAVRARLARLSPAGRALARAAVVLGDDSPLELASELAGLERRAAAAAADELAAAGLVEPGRSIRFRHPLLHSAVAGSLTLAESEQSHLAAAELMRGRGAPPERIAVHLLATAATGDRRDLETLRTTAARAAQRGAPEGAVPLLRRALEEPLAADERAELVLELGRAQLAAGQLALAAEHLGEVVRSAADGRLRARALVPLLQNVGARGAGDFESHLRLVGPTLRELGEQDRELWLRLQAYPILQADSDSGVQVDQVQLDELASLAGDTPGEAVALAHLIFRRVKLGASADEVAQIAERASRQLDALVEDGSSAIAFSAVILGLRWSDRLDLAERLLDRAIATARRRGSMLDFANSLDLRSELYVRRGLLREAEADARDSLATEIEKSWLFARGVKPLLQSLAGQGRTDEAEQIIEREFGGLPLPDVPPMIGLVFARAEVLAAAGKHAAAVEAFDDAVKRGMKWGGASPSQIGDFLIAARSHHALGDPDSGQALVAEADVLARQWGTPGALGAVAHTKALMQTGEKQLSGLRDAVSQLEKSPARLELARALVDLGAAIRRAGQRRDSREPLERGYELARDCGADPLATSASQELAASGVRIRRKRLTGAQSLTPSERRIAEMAASGVSNAEIAQALFVTVKTVEMHLTNVYRKLDIAGRAELRPALDEPAPHTT
jgi:predicted ATPase/DNA-binding CsgD family transcriptional regulator